MTVKIVGMWNLQDNFETRKWSFISAFSVCINIPLKLSTCYPTFIIHLNSQSIFFSKIILIVRNENLRMLKLTKNLKNLHDLKAHL